MFVPKRTHHNSVGISVPTNRFIVAMDASSHMTEGENGCPEWTVEGVGDPRVSLFFKLLRDLPRGELNSLIDNVLRVARKKEDIRGIVDLFVTMFQTRDIRGGKGERLIFYHFFLKMYEEFPVHTIELVHLVPEYGYWKDLINILDLVRTAPSIGVDYVPLCDEIYQCLITSALSDEAEVTQAQTEGRGPRISYCGKYLPQQGKAFDRGLNFCREFVVRAGWITQTQLQNVRSVNWALSRYRKMRSSLNKALNVPEVAMCAREFSSIDFKNVPSSCMHIHRKAFLNESLKTAPSHLQEETGNRHPSNPDRVACRKNLLEHIFTKGLNGKTLYPHEIVQSIMNRTLSIGEKMILQSQWDSMMTGVRENLAKMASLDGTAVDLGNLVPLVDVSGSMSGIPMIVAIAMGIVVSELAHETFRDRVLTFTETPTWVSLSDCSTIVEKVQKLARAPWGMSTNFESAMELIANVVRECGLPQEQVPNLIVFSDMQFNQAQPRRSALTMHQHIVEMFADVGRYICETPYNPPTITYWNLRADTVGFPVQADTPGVNMISGFSPSLLKLILSGDPLELTETVIDEETGDEVTIERDVTPYDTYRKAIDDSRYDPIREVLSELPSLNTVLYPRPTRQHAIGFSEEREDIDTLRREYEEYHN